MKEFLIEIYTEEIPPKVQKSIAEQIEKKYGYNVFYTPCRLCIFSETEEYIEIPENLKRGPKISATETAINGFLGENKKEDLIIIDGYYYLRIPKQKVHFLDFINVKKILESISLPKSMDTYGVKWIRPIRNIQILFNNTIKVLGHKFLSNTLFDVSSKDEYFNTLKDNFVYINQNDRKSIIRNGILDINTKLGGDSIIDESLLEEVSCLVEFPIVLYGKIPQKFLVLPQEVLSLTMRTHQRYFSLYQNGKIMPYFIFISNIFGNQSIISGNEKVLSARLSDTLFLYDLDTKNDLEYYREKLKNLVYHTKLGSMYDKTERMAKLAKFLNPEAVKAAKLSKADLATEIVKEMPELQGIIGSYYTQDSCVKEALKSQYNLEITTEIGAIVALVDRVDHLVGMFYAKEKVTGSQDPFALRRSALGIIKILSENHDIKIWELFDKASEIYGIKPLQEVIDFFNERLLHYLKSNFNEKIIKKSLQKSFHTFGELILEIKEEEKLLEFESTILRIKNILPDNFKSNIQENLFALDAERDLFKTLQEFDGNKLEWLRKNEKVINRFFDEVHIFDEKLSSNRLSLLKSITLLLDI